MKRAYFGNSSTYSLSYTLPYWFMKSVRRVYAGEVTPTIQTRLAMMEFYNQVKDVALVARTFKVSRKTFYKWFKRYNRSDLASLEDQSRAPVTRRKTTLTFEVEEKIKKLRQEHIRLGKKKLAILYKRKYGAYISQHHIQYVIQKYNLYFDPVRAKRLRTKKRHWGAKKIRINEVNPRDYLTVDKPFFFATDTIVLYLPYGIKRYILTAASVG